MDMRVDRVNAVQYAAQISNHGKDTKSNQKKKEEELPASMITEKDNMWVDSDINSIPPYKLGQFPPPFSVGQKISQYKYKPRLINHEWSI